MEVARFWRTTGQRLQMKGGVCEKCGNKEFPPKNILRRPDDWEFKSEVSKPITLDDLVDMVDRHPKIEVKARVLRGYVKQLEHLLPKDEATKQLLESMLPRKEDEKKTSTRSELVDWPKERGMPVESNIWNKTTTQVVELGIRGNSEFVW
jgi:hypothetical protein